MITRITRADVRYTVTLCLFPLSLALLAVAGTVGHPQKTYAGYMGGTCRGDGLCLTTPNTAQAGPGFIEISLGEYPAPTQTPSPSPSPTPTP